MDIAHFFVRRQGMKNVAYFHLPGLFEFYELYSRFLPLFYEHREYFYDWCKIGSIYGSPSSCLWSGGRISESNVNPYDVLRLMNQYNISARLTFSNSLLEEKHLSDYQCNALCKMFDSTHNGIIIHSDLLLEYLKKHYSYYYVSSTTKVITDFNEFVQELNREDFKYVVPDFRLNKHFKELSTLTEVQKDKVEFLCNECCFIGCKERKKCYETVSRLNLGEDCPNHICKAPGSQNGYMFSKAKKNPSFISIEDIQNIYLPKGFSQFKIEGRSLGSALVLEFLLYYMTKPEYQINVREEIYLSNMLDLF